MKDPKQMLQWLKARSQRTSKARQLYGSCVAAARDLIFYRDWHVADSLDGRFEMVMLHAGLLVRRLSADGEAGNALGQAVLEEMVAALDDDLRELGVSDLRVPKKVQAAASAFYGRLRAYDAALTAADMAALEVALQRNVPAGEIGPIDAQPMAAYVSLCAETLRTQSLDAMEAGAVTFPAPRTAA